MCDQSDVTPDSDDDPINRWDANDPRRQNDCFAPPTEPCECYCLHCGRTFMSDQIWFQKVIGDPAGLDGFWMCPTPNCSGAGFTFDIFPTDPVHPANAGWHSFDEGDEYDEDEPVEKEYDPAEPEYQNLDVPFDDDDDAAGEEWKLGVAPADDIAQNDWVAETHREHDEEEARYNAPDQRPRELDWSDRPDNETFNEDDIPC